MDKLRLRRDVIWREAEGEVLALDGSRTNYVSSNASGSLLWRRLEHGASRDELAAALVDEFGIDVERARRDVDAFVAELADNALLEG